MKRGSNKKPAIPITTSQAKDIREYLMENEITGERDSMLFDIGYTTGYRMQDLVDLKVRDLVKFLELGYFRIYEKKKVNALKARIENKKYDKSVNLTLNEIVSKSIMPREIEIVEMLEPRLREFVKGKKLREYAFQTTKCSKAEKANGTSNNISRESYSKIISRAGKIICKTDGISGHSIRKGYAINIYNTSGKDIFIVKELLGHSSIEITKRYLGIDRKAKSEASKGLNNLFT